MTDMLQEFCDSRGVMMRVDAQAGVIRGVKLLGLESRNGRTYLPEALAQAARLYEDAKVNVNHPKGNPNAPRDYQDRIGMIRGVAVRPGEGLFGDFYFNPKHALAEQLMWDAEHAPENVGFSHNVEARVGRRGERVVVEAITRVQSVDLVADPATTRGLFESAAASAETPPALTLDDLNRDHPQLVESIRQQQGAEIERLRQEVDRLNALEAAHRRREAVRRLVARVRSARARGGRSAGQERRRASNSSSRCWPRRTSRRCGRWSKIARGWCVRWRAARPRRNLADSRPQSRDQHLVYAAGAPSGKSFVEAIT